MSEAAKIAAMNLALYRPMARQRWSNTVANWLADQRYPHRKE